MSETLRPHNFILVGAPYNPKSAEAIRKNDKNKDFILIDDEKELMSSLKSRASFINDLPVEIIDFDEIKKLTKSIIKSEFIPENGMSTKYMKNVHDKQLDVNSRETSAKFQRYYQLLDRAYPYYFSEPAISYGLFTPTYYEELCDYKKDNYSEEHSSLLVGALTIDTVQEYFGCVKSVFHNAECLVIDIDGSNLLGEIPNFHIMDGINTTFEKNKFDTIHTNYLLHQLRDQADFREAFKTEEQYDQALTKFFKETYRILKPHGKLIMAEGNLHCIFTKENKNSIKYIILKYLSIAGFKDIQIKQIKTFVGRNDLDRVRRSSSGISQLLEDEQVRPFAYGVVITAIK